MSVISYPPIFAKVPGNSWATFASVPCDSGMILSPRQISIQFVDAEWTDYAALAKQLLESQPAHACKLRSLARGERPSRIERDRHFLEQLGSHLLTWNVHRFRRGIGNFERQLHGGKVGGRSAESKASMGPRSFNRGNLRLIAEVKEEDNASTGPRSWDRGKRLSAGPKTPRMNVLPMLVSTLREIHSLMHVTEKMFDQSVFVVDSRRKHRRDQRSDGTNVSAKFGQFQDTQRAGDFETERPCFPPGIFVIQQHGERKLLRQRNRLRLPGIDPPQKKSEQRRGCDMPRPYPISHLDSFLKRDRRDPSDSLCDDFIGHGLWNQNRIENLPQNVQSPDRGKSDQRRGVRNGLHGSENYGFPVQVNLNVK